MQTPKFADAIAWQQAEMLMQPVFIRVIDNIRKALDTSSWRGTYEQTPIWPADVDEATKARVMELQHHLKTARPEEVPVLEETLMQYPQPQFLYRLLLQKNTQNFTIDLWQLCYQICFRNYNPVVDLTDEITVEVDTSLIELETGEVDWNRLDDKAKQVIEQIFRNLPSESSQ